MGEVKMSRACDSGDENLRVWNNAAFDDVRSSPLQSITNVIVSHGVDAAKVPTSSVKKAVKVVAFDVVDAVDIDAEIESIQKQIGRLSSRLRELRVKKEESSGRNAPAKFAASPTPDRRRGASLGPMEILRTPIQKHSTIKDATPATRASAKAIVRRGASLGPMEISGKKLGSKKIEGVREEKARASLCGAPGIKRKPTVVSKRADESCQSDRSVRRGVSLGPLEIAVRAKSAVQTSDSRKCVAAREGQDFSRLSRGGKGRVVASRYSLSATKTTGAADPRNKRRKWSLSESTETTETGERSPQTITKIGATLPKINTSRIAAMASPRDSGCIKRMADINGRRKPFFAAGGNDGRRGSIVPYEDSESEIEV